MKTFFLLVIICFNQAIAKTIEVNGTISPWVNFNVSLGAKSFIIGVETKEDSPLFIADLIDPNGKVYIQSQPEKNSRISPELYILLTSKNRVMTVSKGLGSVLVPNHDDDRPIKAGIWQMRIGSQSLVKQVYYSIHEKKSNIKKAMRFKVFLDEESKTLGVERMQSLLNSVKELYSRYGIPVIFELNLKQYTHDLPLELDSWINAIQLSKESSPEIHLKRNLSPDIFKDLQGFSGCLPFFQAQFSDKHCALAVSFNDAANIDSNRFVKVIAHEIGHFLGLYHLSDDFYPYGIRTDTVSDTNVSNETFNIMHKTSDIFDEIAFSFGQVKVMKRHPLLFY